MKKYIWAISTKKSTIQFKVKYFKISTITGGFLQFDGVVVTDDSFENPELLVTVESKSIQTQDEQRDVKIKSKSFLNTEEFPDMKFTSLNKCKKSEGGIRELAGDLTIKGISKPIVLVVSFGDFKVSKGASTALFRLFGKLDLYDFPLDFSTYNISNEVLIYTEMFLTAKIRED